MVTDVAGIAYEPWVRTHLPGLLRFAYVLTGSRHDAEDAVQTALAAATPRWASIADLDDPTAYVRRMVVNAHISAWRSFRRRQSPMAEIAATAVDPTGNVDESDAVWRVCAALPPRQRAAVVLRYYEDLDYPEIAALLDCPQATVRSHIHRALTALRAQLSREEPQP